MLLFLIRALKSFQDLIRNVLNVFSVPLQSDEINRANEIFEGFPQFQPSRGYAVYCDIKEIKRFEDTPAGTLHSAGVFTSSRSSDIKFKEVLPSLGITYPMF